MPIQVNVQNGNITPSGSTIGPSVQFQWFNPSPISVEIKHCGNWCTVDSCTVPNNGGTVSVQVLANPNFFGGAFYSSGWNVPGMPHIATSPEPTPMDIVEDVA